MPIPSPSNGESESEFVSRCIAAISGEYEQDQAAAICYRQFRESKSMNKNSQLIEKIKARSGSGEFGYGITTADKYVSEAVASIGNPMLLKHFHCMGSNAIDNLLKRASNTLTICNPETDVEKTAAFIKEQQATSLKAMAKLLGCEPPPHAMMAIVNRLTTPREDRDGDTLQTAGANMDPKAPLLWQHIHTLPIGKMMRVVSQDKDCLKVATVLLDINELTSDACKLFEAGALRFSHGFIAKEFEERKGGGDMARFNILKFDIVEESAVSVPSNVDAEVELFCSGKLHSDPMKAHAKSLFDRRTKSMAVTEKAKAAVAVTKSPTVEERLSALEKLMAEKPKEQAVETTAPQIEVKLDSPIGDMTQAGPVPNEGESQEVFMGRCMLDGAMMDQYPTMANREQACAIQWSKSSKPATKDMGKCKDCGKKADLDKNGYCADCAKKEKPENEGDSENPFKGIGKPSEKAGRVLSQRNYAQLEDAAADMETQLKIMEMPRDAKALGESAHRKVKGVLSSATPVPDLQPSGADHVLRDAIIVVGGDRSARDMMRKAIDAFDKADENEQLAEDFRKLEASVLTG